MDVNIKPPQPIAVANAAQPGAGTVAAHPAPSAAAGNLAADSPAGANLLDALKQSHEQLKTLMTGVDNQTTVQALQTQSSMQEAQVMPNLLATLNKQAAEQREAAIAKV